MDAITMLKDDHQTVEKLFKRFEQAGDNAHAEKREIVGRIVEELSKHAAIEEQIFYPVTRETVPEVRDTALESLEEHHVVKWVLSELDGMDPTAERFDAKVTVLIETVRHHVEEEESEYFPKVRDELGRTALDHLGDALERAKSGAPTHPHPRAPDTPPGNLVAGAGAGVMDRVTDTVSGVAQGGAAAIADLMERVTGSKAPLRPSPPSVPTAEKVAARVRQDVADAADQAAGAVRTAKRTGEQVTDSARSTVASAASGARESGSAAASGARGAATSARKAVKKTARTAKASAKATATSARKSVKKTASTAKKSARATKATAKRGATSTGRTAKKSARATKATAKRGATSTGRTAKKSARATKATAKRGATSTGRTAKKSTTSTGRTAKKSTKKTASKRGATSTGRTAKKSAKKTASAAKRGATSTGRTAKKSSGRRSG